MKLAHSVLPEEMLWLDTKTILNLHKQLVLYQRSHNQSEIADDGKNGFLNLCEFCVLTQIMNLYE